MENSKQMGGKCESFKSGQFSHEFPLRIRRGIVNLLINLEKSQNFLWIDVFGDLNLNPSHININIR